MESDQGGGSSSNKLHRVDEEKSSESGSVGQQRTPIQQLQHQNFVRKALKILPLFAAAALAGLVLYHSVPSLQNFPQNFPASFYYLLSSSNDSPETHELKRVLQKAAMMDKTVIITTLNEAWASPNSIFEVFLESFKIGNHTQWLLNHLVVVALDEKAYALCLKMHPICYSIKTAGFDLSGEAYFMAPDYLRMMWRRIDFLRSILDMGYNFILTDVDIMWFRDPFPHLFSSGSDFQIACDYFYGNPNDINNAPNGGFTYVKSNKKTKEFYRFWYNSRELYPGKHDQDVLNRIKYDPFINKIGLQIKFLDTAYFGGFCEPSKDLNRVCTMHANCCVGLENKVHDLRIMLDDWRKYISLPQNKSHQVSSSWTVPQFCGSASFRPRPLKKNEGH